MPQQKQNKKTAADLEQAKFADELLRDIRSGGAITVAEYMGRVAQQYYAHAVPFGVEGDFTTAPEISQMFGEMIAAWCVDVWQQAGRPAQVHLVELGPGRGTLMADMLRIAKNWPDFAKALSVHLVETSPQLRIVQADNLYDATPQWHDSIDSLPDGFSLVIANEFFDALPIHQFVKKRGVWLERAVGYDAEEEVLCFTTLSPEMDLKSMMPADFMAAPDGSFFEVSPVSLDIAEKLAAKINANNGAALVIDYGHALAGLGDTLQSIARHEYADVLEDPGTRDITAHVDFGTLAHAASAHARVHGPVTQGGFLNTLGIAARAEMLGAKATPKQRQQIMLDLHRLTAPSAMGDLFKVMCWTAKDSKLQPAGLGGEGA